MAQSPDPTPVSLSARPVAELFDLSGQVALVSGGSRGLGLDIAAGLGEAGASVVIAARRQQWLEPAVRALEGRGITCAALAADVSEPDQARRLVDQTLERFERLDVLVNAAGTVWAAPTLEMPVERWRQVLEVNATGTFLLCQAAGRHMLQRGRGKIVNIASIGALVGMPESLMATVGYSASKGAILALTRDLAVKWAGNGVCVNAIAPYFFPTRMTEALIARQERGLVAEVPMRRLGTSDDIVGVALFLASAASDYVTGQVIAVDGGYTAR